MLQEAIAVKNPVCCFGPFTDENVAASQTDAQLVLLAGLDGVVMPKAGYVIGMTGSLSAAATAGSLTVGVSIDGTEDSDTTQTVTTGQEINATFKVDDGIRFTAGQQIGVEITTSSDPAWDGTTADLAVWVWVVFEDWDF